MEAVDEKNNIIYKVLRHDSLLCGLSLYRRLPLATSFALLSLIRTKIIVAVFKLF